MPLCAESQNNPLDTLDEPEARASMIWIIGEYAERIDNADELLESFVEGFHDENTQVQLQLLTSVVKLFLKRPSDTQQLVQRVLSLATQDSDNPDLRDRGYIYWRLLSADPVAAKEVVLAEKPLISEETDLLEPSLLDQLVCHIGSLASVYHKPPTSFVDSAKQPIRAAHATATGGHAATGDTSAPSAFGGDSSTVTAPTVIPSQDTIIADLLSLDLSAPAPGGASSGIGGIGSYQPAPMSSGLDDLLGLGSDGLLGDVGGAVSPPTVQSQMSAPLGAGNIFGTSPFGPVPTSVAPPVTTAPVAAAAANPFGGLGDIFGAPSAGMPTPIIGGSTGYVPPKTVWLEASRAKGTHIEGTFSRRGGHIHMDLTFTNRAMQPLSGFAIQFNKNSFGLAPTEPLQVNSPLYPNQSVSVSLQCKTDGPVQKMEPLTNLQVAVKNDVDVFYFAVVVPLHMYFDENGQMDKREFLQLWKEIPEQNELQFSINNTRGLSADDICTKLQQNNVFTVARRNVEGQELLYHSIKYTNQIHVLSELKMQQSSQTLTLSLKSRHVIAIANVNEVYQTIISNSP